MKIEHIAYIQEIAQQGSVNKAAAQLLVSQPYLSSVVKETEEELGVSLFVRTSRGVTLTPAGKEFLQLGQRITAAFSDMSRLRYAHSRQTADFLSVANIYSFTLLDLFQEFSQRYTGSDKMLSYAEMPNTSIMDVVSRGRANLGFAFYATVYERLFREKLEEKSLVFRPLVEEPFFVVLNRRHPLFNEDILTVGQMRSSTFVVDQSKVDFHRQTFRPWFTSSRTSPVTFDNNRSVLYYLTKADNCFSLGQNSLNLTNPFVVAGQLRYIPLADSPCPLITGYVHPRGAELTPLAEEFCAAAGERLNGK